MEAGWHGDGDGGDGGDSTVDEEPDTALLQQPRCPLCRIDDVSVETAAMVMQSSPNNYLRKIMAYELVNFGFVPDESIYRNIARNYNRNIAKEMRRAGMPCERWTPQMVRQHFECHVNLVPRRVIGNDVRRLEAMSRLVDREIETAVAKADESFGALGNSDLGEDLGAPERATELIDAKLITKQVNIIKAKHAILRDYRVYQKEDMLACGISTLWKSVELGETTSGEAQKLLEKAAMVQTAAGAADLPNASDLFKD